MITRTECPDCKAIVTTVYSDNVEVETEPLCVSCRFAQAEEQQVTLNAD